MTDAHLDALLSLAGNAPWRCSYPKCDCEKCQLRRGVRALVLALREARAHSVFTVVELNGKPTAAPCAIEGQCQYGVAEAEVARLRAIVEDYNVAADKFIAKCESGRALSRETYADLKACRAETPAALKATGGQP